MTVCICTLITATESVAKVVTIIGRYIYSFKNSYDFEMLEIYSEVRYYRQVRVRLSARTSVVECDFFKKNIHSPECKSNIE